VAMRFAVLGPRARLKALGSTIGLPPELRRACESDFGFEPIQLPSPREWLAIHDEPGQRFDEFRENAPRLDPAERRLYLQPFDDLPADAGECLESIAAFLRAFFGLDASVLPVLSIDPRSTTTRVDSASGAQQVYAGSLLAGLAARRPADALCVVGMTARDLYPHAIVNFVFGEASEQNRVGVISVARYGPPYCADSLQTARRVLKRRCCRVVAHEIGHVIGMAHCIYYRCLMNGSADIGESDRRPMHLCPIDLRKLQWAVGFDVVERYHRLMRYWHEAGYDDEVLWIERRLPHVQFGWRGLAGRPGHRESV
jgi:archaemetzincin